MVNSNGGPDMTGPRRYLVVGPSWIGDMVMAQSLFITLKQQHPDCTIDVLAPAWSLPVLERMPQVHRGISSGTGHGEFSLRKRRALGKSLKAKYSHAIVLPRSWKSALVPYFAGIPVRTGYRGEMRFGLLNDIRQLDKQKLTRTVQRYVYLGRDREEQGKTEAGPPDTPFPALRTDSERLPELMARLGLQAGRTVCMMPGAEYGPAKQWPLDHYGRLARRLVEAGWQVWILGSGKDADAGDKIAGFCPQGVSNLCGRTSLVDAIDLLAAAEAAVSNDSGLMHVAAAVGTKLTVIYGSSTPDYTPPLADEEHRNIFYLGLECSPCFERVCPLGHTRCLTEITDDVVFDAIHS